MTQTEQVSDYGRWPGYTEQSWQQRFAELDRRHSEMLARFEAHLRSTSPAGEVGEMIEQLRALHVWPQFVADEHADTLTPRQIKGLYEVGNVAEVAVALLEELSNALAEPKCKCERLAASDTEAIVQKHYAHALALVGKHEPGDPAAEQSRGAFNAMSGLMHEIEASRTSLAGEVGEPSEPGGFVGDIFFGHPEYSTMGTHRWDGDKWERLRSEVEVLCDLLAAARNERDNLLERLAASDTEAMRLLRRAFRGEVGWTADVGAYLARIDALAKGGAA